MKSILSSFVLILISFATQALQLPNDFAATYNMEKYGSTVAKMVLKLDKKNEHITYQSNTIPQGLAAILTDDRISEKSNIIWSEKDKLVRLSSYQYTRKNKAKKNQQIYLDWKDDDNAIAKMHYAGQNSEVATENLVWDRLSVQLALASDLKTNENNKTFKYTVLDKGQLNQYQFEYQSHETLSIGNQQYKAVKVKRPHGNRHTYFWLAKELDFLPVKIEQYKKGELHMSMQLGSIQFK